MGMLMRRHASYRNRGKSAEAKPEPAPTPAPEDEEVDPLQHLTVPQLRELAAEKGIKLAGLKRKEEIRAAIQAALIAAAEAELDELEEQAAQAQVAAQEPQGSQGDGDEGNADDNAPAEAGQGQSEE